MLLRHDFISSTCRTATVHDRSQLSPEAFKDISCSALMGLLQNPWLDVSLYLNWAQCLFDPFPCFSDLLSSRSFSPVVGLGLFSMSFFSRKANQKFGTKALKNIGARCGKELLRVPWTVARWPNVQRPSPSPSSAREVSGRMYLQLRQLQQLQQLQLLQLLQQPLLQQLQLLQLLQQPLLR